jgi:type VI secretion system protein ImpH
MTELVDEPWRYDIIAAARELEQRHGLAALRSGTTVRFGGWLGAGFPPADIASFTLEGSGGRLETPALSLYGPTGVLPPWLNEAMCRAHADPYRDPALRDYLDVFNHRVAVLYYEATTAGDAALAFERRQRGEDCSDHATEAVCRVLGLRPPAGVPVDWLVRYAGLFAAAPSRSALELLLSSCFGVAVRVPHPHKAQECCADTDGTGPGPDADFRIVVGPLSRTRYEDFLPGGPALAPLVRVARLFAGDELAFDVQLLLADGETAGCVLGDGPEAARLDWSSWLVEHGSTSGIISSSICRSLEERVTEGDSHDGQPRPTA